MGVDPEPLFPVARMLPEMLATMVAIAVRASSPVLPWIEQTLPGV